MITAPVPGPRSRNQLHDAARLGDLPLRLLADPSRAHHQRDRGESALAEDLAVAEREQVEHGDGVLGAVLLEVLVALLGGDEGPELEGFVR